jgi:hypothetical protein
VAALAREEARGYLDFGALAAGCSEGPGAAAGADRADRDDWAATCAPSVAVALLAATRHVEAGEGAHHADAAFRAA